MSQHFSLYNLFGSMELRIEAHDSALVNPKSSETRLVIIVDDVNDNSPVIKITYLESDVVDDTGGFLCGIIIKMCHGAFFLSRSTHIGD